MATNPDDIRADLEKQIAELKKELGSLSKTLSSRASEALEEAQDHFEDGKGRAREAAAQVRDQAYAAAGAMRENPGTTVTVLSTVGLLGLAIGYMLGGACAGSDRRR